MHCDVPGVLTCLWGGVQLLQCLEVEKCMPFKCLGAKEFIACQAPQTVPAQRPVVAFIVCSLCAARGLRGVSQFYRVSSHCTNSEPCLFQAARRPGHRTNRIQRRQVALLQPRLRRPSQSVRVSTPGPRRCLCDVFGEPKFSMRPPSALTCVSHKTIWK